MANGYGWDDEVEVAESNFHAFDEGDYDFKVVDFQRGKVKSGKSAGANQAVYTLRISDGSFSSEERYFIPLVESLRWKASKFFKSIGAIPQSTSNGERVKFPWDGVIGMSGRCHVKPRTWTGDDGEEHRGNDIVACLVGDEVSAPKATEHVDYGDL